MIDKNLLKKDFDEYLAELTDGEKPTAPQLHDALARSIMKQAAPVMAKSAPKGRSASYFSAEFLVGRAVYNNLMCLGLLDDAEALLNSAGASLSASRRSRTQRSATAVSEGSQRASWTARLP